MLLRGVDRAVGRDKETDAGNVSRSTLDRNSIIRPVRVLTASSADHPSSSRADRFEREL